MADTSTNRPFRRHPSRYIDGTEAAAKTIVAHFAGTAGHYDVLTQSTEPSHITGTDLLAVGMLGIPVPAPAAAWILGEEGQWLTTEILADLPLDTPLWEADPRCILRAADLFQLLRAESSAVPSTPGLTAVGQATATRILASKRPALCPLDDREVRAALKYPKDSLWFRRWNETINDDLLDATRRARSLAAETEPLAASLTELRVLDIVVRSRAKTRSRPTPS